MCRKQLHTIAYLAQVSNKTKRNGRRTAQLEAASSVGASFVTSIPTEAARLAPDVLGPGTMNALRA